VHPSELVALFARTFVIGIAVAAPVGAMGVLCIQRTLQWGWRSGMSTGLGIATADGVYAAIAAFGVSALAASLVAWQVPLRVVGGVVLVVLGIRAALQPPLAGAKAVSPELDGRRAAKLYSSAVGLTLTNPMTIMAFGAIFASAGLGAQPTARSALVATLGVASGSLSWWTLLVSAVALTRHQVRPSTLVTLNRVSGAVIVVFGLVALVSVVRL
jgi:threonine/homoserine/homoserine lactone efflux protein